jgi:cholestenol delta-isomerase
MGGLQTKIEQPHPYYPPEVLIPSYVANSYSAYSLLSALITAEALCLTTTFFVIKRWRPSISQADILTALWFVLCTLFYILNALLPVTDDSI